MKAAVVDDNPMDVRRLVNYLEQFQAEQGASIQIHPFSSSIDFLEEYDGSYDIVFLDIEMPGSDGLTTAREIRSRDDAVAIIFITNMGQYAIHGYEVNAIDFMIKPVSYFNFAQKLGKAIRFLSRRSQRTVLLQGEDGVIRLEASNIWYVEKERDNLIYHTREGDFRKRGTMKAEKELLRGLPFEECTVGCLVNLEAVQRIGREHVYLKEGQLPLSRRLKKEFTQSYIDYVGGGL